VRLLGVLFVGLSAAALIYGDMEQQARGLTLLIVAVVCFFAGRASRSAKAVAVAVAEARAEARSEAKAQAMASVQILQHIVSGAPEAARPAPGQVVESLEGGAARPLLPIGDNQLREAILGPLRSTESVERNGQ
jgi:hypothetical protein